VGGDLGNRPYRWADTPLDPLAGPSPGQPRQKRGGGGQRLAGMLILVGIIALVVWSFARPDDEPTVVAFGEPSTTQPPSSAPPTTMGEPPAAATEEPVEPAAGPAGRPGGGPGDQLRPIGAPAEIDGLAATVLDATFVDSLDRFQHGSYLLVQVNVRNQSEASQRYGVFDWQLQFPDGHVEMPTLNMRPDALSFGSLVRGGEVTGTVAFEVGPTTGGFFVLFGDAMPLPGSRSSGYGVWPVTRS
jgi:hypothetical protein